MRKRGQHQLGDMGAFLRAARSMDVGPRHNPRLPAESLPEQNPALNPVGGETKGGPPETPLPDDALTRKRRMVALFCKLLGDQHLDGHKLPENQNPLSPRERQTLEHLLEGNSEKQIAARLGISRHTVHVYVKALYKRFGVYSRGELLARWVQK